MGSKKHPFLHFQTAAEPAENEEEFYEDVTMITRFFYVSTGIAHMLCSDGFRYRSDTYVEGPHGFVIAGWFSPKSELELDVPNNKLIEGRIVLQPLKRGRKPAAMKARGKAKGKAKGKTKG